MKVDIWNLSLNGHLEQTAGPNIARRKSLFDLYKGKAIIMLGNSFQYFDRGQRNATDLIDKKDFAPAALAGTSLFLSGMEVDEEGLIPLSNRLRASSSPLKREFYTIKSLVAGVVSSRKDGSFYGTKFVCFPMRRGDNSARCKAKANRAKTMLEQKVPNLRFIITWTSKIQSKQDAAGEIEVLPCTPYDIGKLIVTRPVIRRFEEINGICALFCLPFPTRLEMLWNEWAMEQPKNGRVSTPRGISDTVEYDIVLELKRLINNPPWPDCIPSVDLVSHLIRLQAFFNYDRDRSFSQASIGPAISILANMMLLADFCSGSSPLKLTIATRRKHLCSELSPMIEMFLSTHYSHFPNGTIHLQYEQCIAQRIRKMRSGSLADRKVRVMQEVLAKVADAMGIDISDVKEVTDMETRGTVVWDETKTAAWRRLATVQELQLGEDLAHAKLEVDELSFLPKYGHLDGSLDCQLDTNELSENKSNDSSQLPEYSITASH